MKKVLLFVFSTLLVSGIFAQEEMIDYDALKQQKAEKVAAMDALKGEIDGIDAQLENEPGWKFGTFGTIGLDFQQFNNWIKKADNNSGSSNIGITFNGFANYKQDKYFWRNSGNVGLGWQKYVVDRDNETEAEKDYKNTLDVLRINSLFGYNIAKNLFASAMGDYNTSVLNGRFNDPGYLDIGAGVTWTPIENFILVVHPLNGHFIFYDENLDNVEKSFVMGAKLVADYSRDIKLVGNNLAWTTNFTSFIPYQSTDPSLFEWTWTNGIGFTMWQGIGVGLEFALRGADLESDSTQSYWVLGFNYNL